VLGALGLNHMNGRVQDAVSGRFLSADPHVFQPLDSQGYNRYSYVFNNPLTFIDPSGFRTETRTGQQCFSVPMPHAQVTISGPTVNQVADGNYRGVSNPVPIRLSSGRDTGVYSGPPHAPVFEFAPVVIGMKCIEYSYQVEIPDPPRESSWWDRVKNPRSIQTARRRTPLRPQE
jgi:RHS repeat-associated protein